MSREMRRCLVYFFFSSRRRHTRLQGDWSSDVCSSDLFFHKLAAEGIECFFRRIEFYDEQKEEVLVFLTNHMELAAATIAAVYKERWQIELLFKALKQLLRIKTFVGTTANALKTQIWSALIALLLLKYLQMKATFGWSLSNLVA